MQEVRQQMKIFDLIWQKIRRISQKITYVVQSKALGFGHAVLQAKPHTKGEPVLLLLGDHLFKSNHHETELTCSEQAIDAFIRGGQKTTLLIEECPLSQVVHYGIVAGEFVESGLPTSSTSNKSNVEELSSNTNTLSNKMLRVTKMKEKPTINIAEKELGVLTEVNHSKQYKYFCVFGIYVLTPKVFEILEDNVNNGRIHEATKEYQLTSALEGALEQEGMTAMIPNGKRFDIGLPHHYAETVYHFGKWPATQGK